MYSPIEISEISRNMHCAVESASMINTKENCHIRARDPPSFRFLDASYQQGSKNI